MDNSEQLLSTADQHFAHDRYRQATRIYESLCDDDATRFRAMTGLAKVQLIQGRYQDALDLIQGGLDLQPTDLVLLRMQAAALQKNKEWDRATSAYEQIIADYPTDALSLASYSMFLFERGSAQRAQELAEKALTVDIRGRLAWLALAYSLARQDGKFTQALHTAWQMAKRFGTWDSYSALVDVFRVKYPWLVTGLMAGGALLSLRIQSLLTLPIFLMTLILLGLPAYGYWRTKQRRLAIMIGLLMVIFVVLYGNTQFGW